VTFERAVEAVRDREDADRTGLNARVKDLPGVVDQLRSRVADEERQSSRKTLFELRLQGVIARVADVVAIETDGRETRIGPEQLRARNRRVAQRRRTGDLAEERVCHLLQQRVPLRELLSGELIDVRIRDADVSDLRSRVGDLGDQVAGDLALDGE